MNNNINDRLNTDMMFINLELNVIPNRHMMHKQIFKIGADKLMEIHEVLNNLCPVQYKLDLSKYFTPITCKNDLR